MKRSLLVVFAFVATAHADLGSNVDLAASPRALERVPEWPAIVATKTGIVVDGKAIVSIANGDVDPADKEGGAMGIRITRLADFTKQLVAVSKPPTPGMLVVLDQSLPYKLAIGIVFSAKSAPMKRFGFVAKTPAGLGMVPLELPDKAPASAVNPPGLKMAVAITKDKILLWSLSGLEGSLQKPKLTLVRGQADKLTPALAEIVKRRFKGKRDAVDRQIIVMADAAVPMKDVMAVMFAIRTAADGSELFPDIQLSSGFE